MNDSGLGITKENLMLIVPPALTHDPAMMARAAADAEALEARLAEIDRVRIISNIDGLDEDVLDILAHDFKVDWWDPNYSLEEKRRTIKDSWRVHKTLGTKAAIETALRAIYPKVRAEPWFEYEGGKPYHFRLHIDLSNELWAEGKPQRVLDRVRFYQGLRDHMDSVQYTMVLPPAAIHVGGAPGAVASLGVPQGVNEYDFRSAIHTGGTGGIHATMGMGEDTSPPERTSILRAGGNTAVHASLPGQADPSPPPSTTILRTGGVCTIISNLSQGK